MDVSQHLHMNGGTGEQSYSSNSLVQKKVLSITKPIIGEAILDMFHGYKGTLPKSIRIADLGCSSGSTTFLPSSYIVDNIYKSCDESGCSVPEFLVFLNDLPGNDFNTIFRFNMQNFFHEQKKTKGDGFIGTCFVVGVPGSFYGRLFPSDTLHFVHSSYGLHWLSQVPGGIDDSNMGNIYLAKSSPGTVLEAYLKQFKRDFLVFLRCRSEEVAQGGRMVLTFLGRRSADHCIKNDCHIWEMLAMALRDMASQGIITEENLNSFNMPFYAPSLEEVKYVIQSEGSFIINRLETFEAHRDDRDGEDSEHTTIDKFTSINNQVNCIRAVSEPLLISHFGEGIIDELFCRYKEIVTNHTPREKPKNINIMISVTKG